MATKKTIDDLYESVCNNYGRLPNDDQNATWRTVLKPFAIELLAKAIEKWKGDTTLDFNQNPRGKNMPQAADIKLAAQKQERQERASSRWKPCGKCYEGFIHVKANGMPYDPVADARQDRFVKKCPCHPSAAKEPAPRAPQPEFKSIGAGDAAAWN